MKASPLFRIGLVSALIYALNAIHYGWTPALRNSVDDALAWFTVILLLVLYWAGYRQLSRLAPAGFRSVILPLLPSLLFVSVTTPYDSTDAFQYLAIGWAQSHYGMNPYTGGLRQIPGIEADPMSASRWMTANKNPWLDLPLVYGFGFALLIRAIAWLGHGSWWLSLALLKIVNLAAYVLTAALLWSASAHLAGVRRDIALYLFCWSPLVLLHHLANAHNDILVGCLVVAASYSVIRGEEIWAPTLLVAAALVKYLTLAVIPIALVYILRKSGIRSALRASAAAIALFVTAALPFAADFSRFRLDLISAQLNKVTAGSLFSFLFYSYRALAGFAAPFGSLDTFASFLKVILWAIAGAIALRTLYRFARAAKAGPPDVVRGFTLIIAAVILVGSSQFYSWYLGMVLPLALLLPGSYWLRHFLVVLAGTHVFSLTSLSRKGIGYFLATTGLGAALSRVGSERRTMSRGGTSW